MRPLVGIGSIQEEGNKTKNDDGGFFDGISDWFSGDNNGTEAKDTPVNTSLNKTEEDSGIFGIFDWFKNEEETVTKPVDTKSLEETLEEGKREIQEVFEAGKEAIKESLDKVLDDGTNAIKGSLDTAVKDGKEAINAIKDTLKGTEDLVENIKVDNVKLNQEKIITELSPTLNEMKEAVKSMTEITQEDFTRWGKTLMTVAGPYLQGDQVMQKLKIDE